MTEEKQVNEQTQQNLEVVMAEMRSMREKAKNMENKMNALTKWVGYFFVEKKIFLTEIGIFSLKL